MPLAVLFVVQRTFYAYDDTRTPFVFTLVHCALVATTAVIAQALLPVQHLAAGLALGQSAASILQLVLAPILLHRRLGGLSTARRLASLAHSLLPALPDAAPAWGV